MNATEPTTAPAAAPEVPPGWLLLPAGVTRKVRVVRLNLDHADERPFLIEEGDAVVSAFGVKLFGHATFVRTVENPDRYGCGDGAAWVETDGQILARVK